MMRGGFFGFGILSQLTVVVALLYDEKITVPAASTLRIFAAGVGGITDAIR